jgi:hypothetical protein
MAQSTWERLSKTLERVRTVAQVSEDKAKERICQAIADRVVNIRGKLKEDRNKLHTSNAVLEEGELRIPHDIKPEDLDWENSRPLKLWEVQAERSRVRGLWHLAWIELSSAEVTQHLCRPERQGEAAQDALSDVGIPSGRQPAPESSGSPLGVDTRSTALSGSTGPARRRGPRPLRLERTINTMRTDIEEGRRSVSEIQNMLEKRLSEIYGVSRDTARRARNAVLSEFSENNLRQAPTIDN